MRIFGKVLIGILVVVLLFGGYVIMNVTSIAETQMTEVLRTPVSISRIGLWWNSVTVKGLEIQNIPDSKLDPAFSVSSVQVKADPRGLMEPAAHVEQVAIHQPTIKIELYDSTGKDTNWSRMLAHLESEEETAKEEEGEGQKFVLDHLLLTDIKVVMVGGPLGDEPLEVIVDKIEEHNLTSESQLPIQAIVSAVTQAVVNRAITQALPDLLKKSKEIITKPVEATKGMLEKVVPGAAPGAGEEGGGMLDGFFKK